MDQIVVPQFLDVEDKIIGPITVRQFIEMLIGAMAIFIFYKVFDFSLFVVSGLITILIVLVVAFVRVNGQPFHYFLLNLLATLKNPKLKIWRKNVTIADMKRASQNEDPGPTRVKIVRSHAVTSSRLSELSLIVDTGGVYQGEDNSLN